MYVSISDKLIECVRTHISKMRDAEHNSFAPLHTVVSDLDSPLAVNLIWGEYSNLRHLMPLSWLKEVSSMRVIVDKDNTSHTLTFSFGCDVHVPCDVQNYGMTHRVIDPDRYPEVRDAIERTIRSQDVADRWVKVSLQVRNFLEKSKSLNEALKLWPQLRAFIPNQYLERVEAPTTRTKPDSDVDPLSRLKALDTDMLASSAVIARMAAPRA